MNEAYSSIIQIFKTVLINEFGNKLSSVILFGSMAENRATETSDIDVAVILNQSVDWQIRQRIYDLAFEAEGDTGRLLNVTVFSKDEFEGRSVDSLLLIENIMQQGVSI